MAKVTVRASARLQRMLDGSAFEQLKEANAAALRDATLVAQQVTRQTFNDKQKRTSDTPDRPGRRSTHGQFAANLDWDYKTSGGESVAFFDWETLDAVAPYWLTQEVGTGRSFRVVGADSAAFPSGLVGGRVKSQRGRTLPIGLQWGIGGVYVPPGEVDGAQLMPLSQLQMPEGRGGNVHPIKIRREIEGKHFVQAGANAGFEFYRNALVSEYRRVFQ